MENHPTIPQYILGALLILSSCGVILFRKPVHASLSFLVTLLCLAALYLQLSAEFIGVMQILVYAGAILVLFMFVIILFQDAYLQIEKYEPQSQPWLLVTAAGAFMLTLTFLGVKFAGLKTSVEKLPQDFGMVESLGKALYVDFFFPFEAIILLFLIALVGTLYIGRKPV